MCCMGSRQLPSSPLAAMTAPTAKDRLIVALDMPTIEEAQRLVAALGDTRQLLQARPRIAVRRRPRAGARPESAAQARLPRHEAARHRQHGRARRRQCHRVRRRFPHRARPRPEDHARRRDGTRRQQDEAARRHGADQPHRRRPASSRARRSAPADLVLRRAKLARESGFDGVIASGQEAARIREAVGPGFLIVTPGIRLTGSATDDQERITTPGHAIAAGADYIVVGRPITQADDPKMIAENFINHIREAKAPAGKPS